MDTKRCNRCGEDKAVEDFYRLKPGKPWRAAYCKPCDKTISSESSQKHPGRNREYVKRWRAADPLHARLMEMEKQARYKWRAAGLHVEHFHYSEILERDGWTCYLCGGAVQDCELSFDHVIPRASGGPHTRENVRVAHFKCNDSKGIKAATEPIRRKRGCRTPGCPNHRE